MKTTYTKTTHTVTEDTIRSIAALTRWTAQSIREAGFTKYAKVILNHTTKRVEISGPGFYIGTSDGDVHSIAWELFG